MPIDVSKLTTSLPAQETGLKVELLDEEGEKTGCSMLVAGPDSKRVKKAQSQIVEERGQLRIRKVSADRMDHERRFMAASAVISWDGFTNGDQPFECTVSNAMKLFEAKPDFLEQVEAVSNNRAVFPKA